MARQKIITTLEHIPAYCIFYMYWNPETKTDTFKCWTDELENGIHSFEFSDASMKQFSRNEECFYYLD